jgi:hypothetical protein
MRHQLVKCETGTLKQKFMISWRPQATNLYTQILVFDNDLESPAPISNLRLP